MEILAYEMQFHKETIESTSIQCIPFDEQFFHEYMKIYNECFYEMRKTLDIEPYNYLHDYEQIASKVHDIYLLMNENDIIGSVACYGNEIDDLIVNKRYQHKGYGRQLLLWGMNLIRGKNDEPILLHVAEWNQDALSLYQNTGFEITNTERIR